MPNIPVINCINVPLWYILLPCPFLKIFTSVTIGAKTSTIFGAAGLT
jgi:hypothetical protein